MAPATWPARRRRWRAPPNGKFDIVTTADPEVVMDAERIVLPGVGAFADCMRGLSAVPGMVEALREKVLKDGAPFLGICVGMQLLATVGRGVRPSCRAGLDRRRSGEDHALRSQPENSRTWAGTNSTSCRSIRCWKASRPGSHAYFVHSFRAEARPARRSDRHHRLWRAADRHGRQREYRRHAISSGEEPGHRPEAAGEFLELATLSEPPSPFDRLRVRT